MLKLKITASILGVASFVLLITGSTHLTAAMAVICTTVAIISAIYIMLRLLPNNREGAKVFITVMMVFLGFILVLVAMNILLNEVRVYDTPLSAPVDSVQNLRGISSWVSGLSSFAILLATIAPWPLPEYNDDED